MFGIGSIIRGAAGAASSIAGSLGKNKQLSGQIKAVENRQDRLQNMFDRDYNTDATQKADTQRLLNITLNAFKNRKSGGNEAGDAAAANKEAAANALTNTVANIAVNNENQKEQIKQNYANKYDALQAEKDSLASQKQSGWDIASNALTGAAQVMGAGGGIEDEWKKLG